MFARAEYKFAQGRGPQLGISVSMPNASKRHAAIQGGISTSTISPMMGMGFQDGVGDESRRQDPLAKASRRVTMARGTSPSRTSPSRSLKRATIKHIPGSGMGEWLLVIEACSYLLQHFYSKRAYKKEKYNLCETRYSCEPRNTIRLT
jgi:hypothetical protein